MPLAMRAVEGGFPVVGLEVSAERSEALTHRRSPAQVPRDEPVSVKALDRVTGERPGQLAPWGQPAPTWDWRIRLATVAPCRKTVTTTGPSGL